MRLFVSTDESSEAFSESLESLKKINVRNATVRWQKANQIHLTLRFIGDLKEEKFSFLEKLISTIAKKYPKQNLQFDKWLAFPERGPVRIVALGSSRPLEEIKLIAQELDKGCVELGSASEDRDFVPHITLARVKDDHSHGELRKIINNLPNPEVSLSANALILYRSHLKPEGAEYEKLSAYPLIGI